MRNAQECYRATDTALVLLPPGSLLKAVEKAATAAKVTLYRVKHDTDLIAIPSFLTILDPSLVSKTGWDQFIDFLAEVGDNAYKVVLTAPGSHRRTLPCCNLISTPGTIDWSFLKFLLLRMRATVARRRRVFEKKERQILRILWMLRLLDRGKEVALRDVATEFDTSLRTVQRDVELIFMAGWPLEPAAKGTYRFPKNFRAHQLYS